MSKFWPAAVKQGLYETSTTKFHDLMTEFAFTDPTDSAPVVARYMKNNSGATVAAGKVVAHGQVYGEFVTAFSTAQNAMWVAGGLAASCDSTGYAWVIFKGRQTNASAGTTYASSASSRALVPDGSAALISTVALYSTSTDFAIPQVLNIVARLESGTQVVASTAASNTVVWMWR